MPRLAYRLLDPNSGAVVVPNLYHLHQSTWTVRALLAGYPGSSTIGDFSIQLPAPYSEEFKVNAAQYQAILSSANKGIGLKVEGYNGDAVAGTPVLSGVITKMDLPLGAQWVLSGSDTLLWLQQSQLMPGEVLAAPGTGVLPTHGYEIVEALSGTQEVIWDDDFTNWNGGGSGHTSSDYTLSNFSFTSSDPVAGQPALTSTSLQPTDAYALTSTSWNKTTQYAFSTVSIHGSMVAGTAGVGATVSEASIILLSDSTWQNGVLLLVALAGTATAGLFNVTATIYTKSSGTYTLRAGTNTILQNVRSPFSFEVFASIYFNAGRFEVRITINGQDANTLIQGVTVPASGRIGLRFSASTGGSPAVYVNRIQFHGRNGPSIGSAWGTPRFPLGTINTGSAASIASELSPNQATHLDMMTLAASVDGFALRKNPGAGANADSLDYTASPGTDYSASVVFEEGVNIVAQGSTFQNIADLYGTDAKVNGVPGTDSGGSVTWGRIGAAGDMVLTDTSADVGPIGFAFLLLYAKAIQSRKAAPLVAVQLAVARTAELLKANNGWGPREWDTVQVHVPTYVIDHQSAMIVGYTISEASAVVTYYLTQFPESRLPQAPLQAIKRALDYLSTTYKPR